MSIASTEISIRPLVPADIPAAHALSVAVGWPHRLEDWQFALAVGHGIVAATGGRIVGTAMWWTFGPRAARLGMVIVDPILQRSGLGTRLMNHVLERIADMASVFLVATKAGAPLYRKLGFVEQEPVTQHQGVVVSNPRALETGETRLRAGTGDDLGHLAELDRQATGVLRQQVIGTLLGEARAVVLESVGQPIGFAIRRRFGRGEVIGPVVARNLTDARTLITGLIEDQVGRFIRADVPHASGLSSWLAEQGLAPVSEVVTMVRGGGINVSGSVKRFALINQAMG